MHSQLPRFVVIFFFRENDRNFRLEAPFGVRDNYHIHLRLIGKLVGDFVLVLIELFTLGAFVLSQCTRLAERHTQTDVDSKTVRMLRSCTVKTAVHAIQKNASSYRTHAEITMMYRLSNRNATFTNIAIVYTFDSVYIHLQQSKITVTCRFKFDPE